MPASSTQTVASRGGKFFFRPGRFILSCYAIILLPSTLILMTKVASITGLSWIDALFTATSALTVTGLGVVDTGQHFTLLGHLWMLLLMQIGGMGQMTVSMLILILLGRRISMRERAIVREELNQHPTVDVRQLIRAIALFSLVLETIGTLILCVEWIPQLGVERGIYYSVFHAVSAFNNAGFSLFSDGLAQYTDSFLVCLTLPFLYIVGGLGFTVIIDLISYVKARRSWRLSLHTKLVLWTSASLLIFGTALLYFLEMNNPHTFGNMPGASKWLNAFFLSSATRTAGFSTVSLINMTHASMLVMMVLMFIGAGSSSTGGGIKVSTFAIAIIATRTFLQGGKSFYAFKRNIGDGEVLKSLAIIVVSFFTLITATFILMISEKARFDVVLFEAISAFSTVGLTAGLTENLTDVGKFVLVLVMIIGRLGPLTLALALIPTKPTAVRYAEEDVLTG